MDQPLCTYNPEIYGSESARAVLPEVFRLLGADRPVNSCVDVGCGPGYWLAAARELGVERLAGIDGSPLSAEDLQFDASAFRMRNLEEGVDLEERFDLCLCLEVAEHLPTERAAPLVHDLTRLSSAVLFSAAIPGQTGQRHLNLQWPAYWAQLFAARGFECCDLLRPLLWERDEVAWWYRQNIMLYVQKGCHEDLARSRPRALVHPEGYRAMQDKHLRQLRAKGGLRGVLRELGVQIRKRLGGKQGTGP